MTIPAGRKTPYSSQTIKKSFTLASEVVQRLESRSQGNLSLTVNELLERALDREDELERIRDLASMMGTEVDPEVEVRAMQYLLEIVEKAGRAPAVAR
jgi:hypothetical protein